ncbi:MAG: Crp/Fnr family transcriptional regulator [Vicinamibacterales bacterium]
MPPASADALLRSRIFDGLTDLERERWLGESEQVVLKRGQPLARQGEPARRFYLVECGFLKLTQVTADGDEVIVRFVGPGEPFGGVVALKQADYPVTALAVVHQTQVRAWPYERLAALLDAFPQVRLNIMREMTAHMTDALTRVRELTTERVGQRLAHTLLRLARQCGEPTKEGVLIAHPLTRQELAEMTGTTLYTVSRTLRRWETAGVLRSEGRRLIVRSTTRLTDLAGDEED